MKNFRAYVEGKNLYSIFIHIVILLLVFEVILLVQKNRTLKRWIEEAAFAEGIRTGDYFSIKTLRSIKTDVRIDSSNRIQTIFVFSTRCPVCKETIPKWKTIEESATPNKVSVVGICLDSTLAAINYTRDQNIHFPVFVPEDLIQFARENKLKGVPYTIIRDHNGQTKKVWKGPLSEQELREFIEAVSKTAI